MPISLIIDLFFSLYYSNSHIYSTFHKKNNMKEEQFFIATVKEILIEKKILQIASRNERMIAMWLREFLRCFTLKSILRTATTT